MRPSIIFSSVFRALGFGGTAQHTGEQLSSPVTPPNTPVNVTEDTALSLSAVFGAVRIIAETVAGLSIYEYRRKGGKWVEDPDGELYTMLMLRPNQWMTSIDFWESVLLNLVLRGNGYALIMRNSLKQPIGLYPLAAAQVRPIVLKDGTGWYLHNQDGVDTLVPDEDMLHFRIFGNGRVGLSPLAYGVRSMGLAAAADDYASGFYTRGGRPGGVLTIDRVLTPPQREEVRKLYSTVHEGTDAAHRLFVLEAGMKYQAVQLDPEAVQMLQTRQFSVKDVGRFFGVPVFLLNESEGSTNYGTGLEQQMLGFYNLTIRPYCNRIAATIRMKLIPVGEQRRRKVMHDFDELLAVDLKAKADYLQKLTANGIMTRAEARERVQLEPHGDPAANLLTVQSAMIPLGMMGKVKPESTTKEPGEKE